MQIKVLIQDQLNLIGLALTFFSRIPCPFALDYSTEKLNQASRYFALIGWILGLLVALTYYASNLIFNEQISLWLAMGFSLMLTGCFHEDGLADMADGFGGGLDKNHKLAIMKDSRLGTYGASILVFALTGKFLLLNQLIELNDQAIWFYLPLAYALSRAVAASLIFDMQYQSAEYLSKSKPLASQQKKTDVLLLLVTLLPALWLLNPAQMLILLVVLLIFRWRFKTFLNQQISGYTGDCLGAAQQLAELVIYLSLIASYAQFSLFQLEG